MTGPLYTVARSELILVSCAFCTTFLLGSAGSLDLGLPQDLRDPITLSELLLDVRVGIRLVRGTCLTGLHRAGQRLIRCQELESHATYGDAFVSREELMRWRQDEAFRQKIRIIGVSHVWETMQHPDPRGHQLAFIVGGQHWHDKYSWYFLDYMSVYQFYRPTHHQNMCFQHTMMHMHFFFAHEHTWTYRIEKFVPMQPAEHAAQIEVFFTETGRGEDGGVEVRPIADLKENSTPYSQRGWCEAECQWSSMRSSSSQTIDLLEDLPDSWSRAPMSPILFKSKVAGGELLFTHRESSDAVMELQERVFMQKALECELLELSKLPACEVLVLSGALPFYKNLQEVSLVNSRIDVEGAEALGRVLQVRKFRLKQARLSSEAVSILARVLSTNEHIIELAVTECLADDAGAAAFAEVLMRNSFIRHLDLSRNVIECPGAKLLFHTIATNRSLQSLKLAFNRIADDGAAAAASLLEIQGLVLQSLDLDNNELAAEGVSAIHTVSYRLYRSGRSTGLAISCNPFLSEAPRVSQACRAVWMMLSWDVVVSLVSNAVYMLAAFEPVRSGTTDLLEFVDLWVTLPVLVAAFFAWSFFCFGRYTLHHVESSESKCSPGLYKLLWPMAWPASCVIAHCSPWLVFQAGVASVAWVLLAKLYSIGCPQLFQPLDGATWFTLLLPVSLVVEALIYLPFQRRRAMLKQVLLQIRSAAF